MVSYVNVHAILEGRRDRAKKSPSDDSVLSQVILFYFILLDASWLLFCAVNVSFLKFYFL